MADVHAMLDLETLGQGSNAFIVQVCLRTFDGKKTFVEYIDPWRQQAGSEIDNSTMQWWQKQPIQVRKKVMGGEASLSIVLERLNAFVAEAKITHLWANSPSFDCVILDNAYKRLGVDNKLPKFWAWRDVRTVVHIATQLGAPLPKLENTHNAEHDVVNQITLVKQAFDFLNLKG